MPRKATKKKSETSSPGKSSTTKNVERARSTKSKSSKSKPSTRTTVRGNLVAPTIVVAESNASDVSDRVLFLGSTEDVNRYLNENADLMEKQYRKAKRLLGSWKKELLSGKYGTVTGFGIELYAKRGMVVMPPQYCITVSLAEKAPPEQIRRDCPELDPFCKSSVRKSVITQLPKRYPVDVDVTKSVRVKINEANCSFASAGTSGKFAAGVQNVPQDVVTPLQGGAAISKDGDRAWGTLGIVFPTKNGPMAMSCKHVVASGTIVQPPFAAVAPGATGRQVGTVGPVSFSPTSGVDAALVTPSIATTEGVLDISIPQSTIRILVEDSARWFRLGQQSVALRGARTGLHKFALINNVDFSIDIDGNRFSDLIKVHAVPASSSIVDEGDSGSALLLNLGNNQYVWIGVVVGMIDSHQLVACKLPNCMAKLNLSTTDFKSQDLWKIA